MGHAKTTGIDTIGCFLSSTLLEANTKKKKYSERLVCLSQFPFYHQAPKNFGPLKKTNITVETYKQMKILNPPIVKNSEDYINLAVKLAQNTKKNFSLREESIIAANKYLYNNLKALKEFEQFLEEAYISSQSRKRLNDGHIINF